MSVYRFYSLVPTLEGGIGQCCFGDAYTLAFSAGYPWHEVVPYLGVAGMANTVHGHDNIAKVIAVSSTLTLEFGPINW